MRAAFSEIIRKKLEENPILKKVFLRVITLSFSLAIIFSALSCHFFYDHAIKLNSGAFTPYVLVIVFSVFLGSFCSLIVFGNILIHIKYIVYELSNDKPRWERLEEVYMESNLRSAYLAIKKLYDSISSQSKAIALAEMASQVAHDIRSPLAAINTAVADVASIPEKKRIMIRNAAKRINDIANNLLTYSKHNIADVEDAINNNIGSPELIFVILDNIIAEKRYEYHRSNVEISLVGLEDSYNCFSNIHLDSFKRVFSNLINNAIEAVKANGTIIISLTCTVTHVEIMIEDNGCGIPADILPKVTEQGFSFNKKGGAGFGLTYAKRYFEQINGSMRIHSEEKIGTKIRISLIRSNHPSWFCDSMNIQYDSIIIVLDDDPSIHNAWDERFASISRVKIIHFHYASELLEYRVDLKVPILYLVDYELLADVKNGLEIIEELQLNNKAFLITSYFEDIAIRIRCENIGVKIIPKSYVPYIKIFQISNAEQRSGLVFIDDDEMIRMAWSFAAEEAGQMISTFSSFDEFINEINNYSNDTIIYIDSELGNNIKGEDCAKLLFDKGFVKIYLATGHSKDRFNHIPWIKSIVGKEPPFLLSQCVTDVL